MIKTILFATDLGAFTAHSVLHVESLANQYDAKVVVLHALPPMNHYTSAMVRSHCSTEQSHQLMDSSTGEIMLAMKEQIFDALLSDQDQEGAGGGLVDRLADIVVAQGAAATVILQEAQKCEADLIVIGSHGVDAIDGSVLGSVASKVLQLAKTPVYMVPMINPKGYRASESQSWARK